ncbi:gliding motility lipoprotein GldB [Belliella pelovolcani]|uniref:gliding motility lipoprotein GldB n=1 Tax=Belliella pelovolcani TaxID=529505 RepID=UPI00391D31D5
MKILFNYRQWILLLMLTLTLACKNQEEECRLDEKILAVPIDFDLERLEDRFYNAYEIEEIDYLLEAYPDFTDKYLQVELYDSKAELAKALLEINQDSLMQELYQEVKQEFSDFEAIEQQLRDAFAYIKYYFPEFKVPKVYTYLSGFGNDLLITEDLIVIGLDYYLPKNHRFQPPDLPQYMADRYERDFIVPMIVTAISSRYNQVDLTQNTLLAEMIFYGKAYHFTKAMLPCISDEYIIGYTTDEIAASYANEALIWSHFIENDLLFITNPFEIRKYTGEAPSTDEISPDAPGRLGRWLGWNIVDDYRFNNELELDQLMAETDAEKIFRRSGYKPRQ